MRCVWSTTLPNALLCAWRPFKQELTIDTLGLLLAEGKAILSGAKQYFVREQCRGIAWSHSCCERCGIRLRRKGYHDRQIRTVFGRVVVRSVRLRHCQCQGKKPDVSFSPLLGLVPAAVTPELEYLQVKWAAHLSYAVAASMLAEVLPIADVISVSSVKRRVRAVGAALDASATAGGAADAESASNPSALSALAVDSAWLRHCEPPRQQGRHVNLVAGRACFEDGHTRVYAYVHNQVSSAAGRLHEFLAASGVSPDARVTILTDGAGEFDKAAKGCKQPVCRILDWFHIAMKIKAAERSVFGSKFIDLLEREGIEQQIQRAKLLVWHGKAGKAVARLMELGQFLLARSAYQFGTLWWNVHGVAGYIRDNPGFVNYVRQPAPQGPELRKTG